jgi:hypothetical protein
LTSPHAVVMISERCRPLSGALSLQVALSVK